MEFELTAGNVKSAMQAAGAGSSDLWKVPMDQLHILEGFNVRTHGEEHRAHIAALTESILQNGFYANHPLAGYVAEKNGKQIIFLTDGHCRLEAAAEAVRLGAEIKALPVVVSPKGTSVEDLTVGLVTNNSGHPLTQYEIGIVCKRLVGFGWDEKEIGKRLGMPASRIRDLLDLVGAPASVRDAVADGAVSATQAISTIKQHGAKAGEVLQAGIAQAKAKGKKKATRKHIESKPTYRSVVVALLEWAKESGAARDNGLKAVLKLAREASA